MSRASMTLLAIVAASAALGACAKKAEAPGGTGVCYHMGQDAEGGGVRFNVGTNIRSSAYVAPDLDPIGLQKAYATIDSSLEVTIPGDHITFALVGRNLGDVRAKTYLVNNPFFSGTKSASIIEPRTLEVRATVRF